MNPIVFSSAATTPFAPQFSAQPVRFGAVHVEEPPTWPSDAFTLRNGDTFYLSGPDRGSLTAYQALSTIPASSKATKRLEKAFDAWVLERLAVSYPDRSHEPEVAIPFLESDQFDRWAKQVHIKKKKS